MIMSAVQTHNDRIAVSYLMALGLHVVVLLGVGFALDFKPLTHPLETLDVVLVNWRSESPPEDADFLAQASQQGGGESDNCFPVGVTSDNAKPGGLDEGRYPALSSKPLVCLAEEPVHRSLRVARRIRDFTDSLSCRKLFHPLILTRF